MDHENFALDTLEERALQLDEEIIPLLEKKLSVCKEIVALKEKRVALAKGRLAMLKAAKGTIG